MNSNIEIKNGDFAIEVNVDLGARISSFSVNGKNSLTVTGPQTGSTFWPSPQHSWGWPPPAVLDSASYVATQLGESWVFTSAACPQTGLILSKIISPVEKGFVIEYRMHNATKDILEYAPWEISRIDGGLTFYMASQAPLAKSNLPVSHENAVFWHNYLPAGYDINLKLFANNSAGWLANVNNGLVLKKEFATVPENQVAPEEAEVEIYAHGDPSNPYIEIEQQGPFGKILPGETERWCVTWKLAELPPTIVAAESAALVAFAENL